MKKIVLALLVLITAQQAWAQHAQMETLFSPKPSNGGSKISVGGYGSAVGKLTPMNDKLGVLTGLQGGVLLNHHWMFGAGGYALVNRIKSPRPYVANDDRQSLQVWYTGLMAEYTHNPQKLIHWTVGALAGGGGVGRADWHDRWHDDDDNDHGWHDGSGFFVIEPSAGIEMNVTSFLRLNLGGSYRFIRGSNTVGISDNDLSGPSFQLSIKAGKF